MHALVIGGTGVLRPAVVALSADGASVSVVARGAAGLCAVARETRGRAHPVAVDHGDPAALAAALDAAIGERGAFDLVLAYLSAAPTASSMAVAARAPARLVHLLTSRHAAPDADPSEVAAASPPGGGTTATVLLGWHGGGASARWHTPAEISAAALTAVHAGSSVLGRTRPWAERPS